MMIAFMLKRAYTAVKQAKRRYIHCMKQDLTSSPCSMPDVDLAPWPQLLHGVDPAWQEVLRPVLDSEQGATLWRFLDAEYKGAGFYPSQSDLFAAFRLTPLQDVRVVILGQDPYHGAGQAHGLSFSVPEGAKIPPSLRNIYKEIGGAAPTGGNLTRWAEQGVLLLNTVLTVRPEQAASHQKRGWEDVTDAAIKALSAQGRHVVFLLWGSHAQKKAGLIDAKKHLILTAPHPSPLSAHRGFLGSGHFTKANDYLAAKGRGTIDWTAGADAA
jgi:uracil-DNA glycosylase